MKNQQGFSLIMAIFVLVAVALLGIYMVYLSGVQKQTANDAIQGARAYQAARAGIEWSIATINNGGNCTQINAQTALTFAGLTNFPVTLNCTGSSYSEGNTNGYIYNITSLSQYDSYTAGDYAAREISIYIVD